jgi:hypothetical protein
MTDLEKLKAELDAAIAAYLATLAAQTKEHNND